VNDLWSEGKCGLKILQYFGVAVPAVCTPVGVNKDVITDGVSGFYARSPGEWLENLSALIANPALRKEMGLKGRQTALKDYTVQACAPKLVKILKAV
jgi:glycosyltransferase involved in cell wall biosynthesis